jgi:hypothetical protein
MGGSDFHTFTVVAAGEVDITLTAAGPPSTIFMGIGVGTPSSDGTTCALISGASTIQPAGNVPQLSGTANPGNYCISVYDVGNQTAPITYTIAVVHP